MSIKVDITATADYVECDKPSIEISSGRHVSTTIGDGDVIYLSQDNWRLMHYICLSIFKNNKGYNYQDLFYTSENIKRLRDYFNKQLSALTLKVYFHDKDGVFSYDTVMNFKANLFGEHYHSNDYNIRKSYDGSGLCTRGCKNPYDISDQHSVLEYGPNSVLLTRTAVLKDDPDVIRLHDNFVVIVEDTNKLFEKMFNDLTIEDEKHLKEAYGISCDNAQESDKAMIGLLSFADKMNKHIIVLTTYRDLYNKELHQKYLNGKATIYYSPII